MVADPWELYEQAKDLYKQRSFGEAIRLLNIARRTLKLDNRRVFAKLRKSKDFQVIFLVANIIQLLARCYKKKTERPGTEGANLERDLKTAFGYANDALLLLKTLVKDLQEKILKTGGTQNEKELLRSARGSLAGAYYDLGNLYFKIKFHPDDSVQVDLFTKYNLLGAGLTLPDAEESGNYLFLANTGHNIEFLATHIYKNYVEAQKDYRYLKKMYENAKMAQAGGKMKLEKEDLLYIAYLERLLQNPEAIVFELRIKALEIFKKAVRIMEKEAEKWTNLRIHEENILKEVKKLCERVLKAHGDKLTPEQIRDCHEISDTADRIKRKFY